MLAELGGVGLPPGGPLLEDVLGAGLLAVGRRGDAVAGPLGVAHVVRLLRDELEIAMALSGCAGLDSIAR